MPQSSKPAWLKRRLPAGSGYERLRSQLARNRVHTVCQEANCPNIWECFFQQTATFLILGNRCTRSCGFCAVSHGTPEPPDAEEPERIAETAREMQLDYIVVTSVTRDDLPDGGAGHFAETIRNLHKKLPNARVEVLIPDFMGNSSAIDAVLNARPAVLNHNLETVSRLHKQVRPKADYSRSLKLLERFTACASKAISKSGLMLGIGETDDEIMETLKDLRSAGCRLLTLGQYLPPSRNHLPVCRYFTPEEFDHWRFEALAIGFDRVASGPFVRSSYHAKELCDGCRSENGL